MIQELLLTSNNLTIFMRMRQHGRVKSSQIVGRILEQWEDKRNDAKTLPTIKPVLCKISSVLFIFHDKEIRDLHEFVLHHQCRHTASRRKVCAYPLLLSTMFFMESHKDARIM